MNCYFCNHSETNWCFLENHIKEYHPKLAIICQKCNKPSIASKDWMCNKCNNMEGSSRNCYVCKKSLPSNAFYKNQYRCKECTYEKIKCDYCERVISRKNLSNHKKRYHTRII